MGYDIYRTIGGYVTGNLAISLIAGITSTAVLLILGVPYAVALGLLVAILDLIPLAGATIAAVIVSTIGFIDSTTSGIVLIIFFILYQQLENHVLQPVVYGRTVLLSPLAVLIAVLIGAQIAGVIGALAAIPVAGAIQVILVDWLEHRRGRIVDACAERYELTAPSLDRGITNEARGPMSLGWDARRESGPSRSLCFSGSRRRSVSAPVPHGSPSPPSRAVAPTRWSARCSPS